MKYIQALIFSLLISYTVFGQETVPGLFIENAHDSYNDNGLHESHIYQWNRLSLALKSENNSLRIEDWRGGASSIKNLMTVLVDGNVGIGTITPKAKLEVNGNAIIGDNSWAGLTLNGIGSNDWTFNAHNDGNSLHIRTQNDGQSSASRYIMSIKRDTGSVGIGTTNPSEKLEVRGSLKVNTNSSYSIVRIGQQANDAIIADNYDIANDTDSNTYGGGYWFRVHDETLTDKYRDVMMIAESGNVGIGTKKPDQKLVVNGAVSFDYGNGSSHNGLRRSGIKTEYYNGITNGTGVIHQFTGTRGAIMSLTNDNVGIGTTDTQGFKLGVNGDIAATKVKVALYDNWPDYVFEDTYDLPTLKEVEAHINEKGHLQNVPSAKEVGENGFFLEEMDSKLLQKIEELTLYTIEQEKKIELLQSLKTKNEELEARLAKLEKLLVK